jgi:hypothetical protein
MKSAAFVRSIRTGRSALLQLSAELGVDLVEDFRRQDAEGPYAGLRARDRAKVRPGPEKLVPLVEDDPQRALARCPTGER